MPTNIETITSKNIQNHMYSIRNIHVMIDSDLAKLYKIETRTFNQAVKRNIERFPESFRFQLTEDEFQNLKFQNGTSSNNKNLRSQIATSSSTHGGRRYRPYAFTEQGVAMLSAVLRSETAIKVSIQIIDVFVKMRRFLFSNADIFSRINSVEKNLLNYKIDTDSKFDKIFDAIETKEITPKQGIFYNGQIFDAYSFVSDLIKNANSHIILIDNYIDESVLTLLNKRKANVSAIIFTQDKSKTFHLDLKKYNAQYPHIKVKPFDQSHDRFLIIDNKEMYHIGASLKDLGKKWFAFSRMDSLTNDVLNRIKNNEK